MNELYHHGILGQKWGVRRFQPYPKGKHGTFLGQSRDNDIVLKKGDKAYRIQTGDKLVGEGQTYVTFDKLDSLSYAACTADGFGGLGVNMRDGSGKLVEMKLTNDIIAPSYQKTMEAFIRSVDKVGVKNITKDFHRENESKADRQRANEKAKEFIKNYKHLDIDEMRDKAYESFTRTFMQDTKAKEIFFNDLKNQGYNALIDENDKSFGKDSFTESPMIVFDKQNDLKVTKSNTFTEKDADYFCALYQAGNDEGYLDKFYKDSKNRWDKWAGTTNRRSL